MNHIRSNLRWIWSHSSKVKKWIILATVLMGVEAFLNLTTIGLQKTMIDVVMVGEQYNKFWTVLLQIGLSYIGFSVMFVLAPHIMHFAMAGARASMAEEIMKKIHRLPIPAFQDERTAKYVYYFSKDMESNYHLASSDIPRFVQQLVTVLMIVTVIAMASPTLLAVMFIMVFIYILLGKKFAPHRKQAASDINNRQSELLVMLEEGISSTREVVAFHRHDWEKKKFTHRFDNYFWSVLREGKLINKQLLFSDPIKWGSILFVIYFSGHLVLKETISIGLFVVLFQYSTRFMDSVGGLYEYFMGISGKFASVDRIQQLLQEDSLQEGKTTIKGPVQSIEFKEVSFLYEDEQILKRVNLLISANQKAAIVGSSGGGKSTISKVLIRFFDPTEGEIYINGVNLHNITRSDWANRAAIVFQEPYLFPDTIRNNLLLGRDDVTDERMVEVCRALHVHDVIMNLTEGYDTIIGERGITLSGGQRQLLSLARAVIRDTEILILDEATSALDLETERKIQASLDELRGNRITIIIAHRLSTIQNSDIIFVMNQGVVAEEGNHHSLMGSGTIYKELING